MAQSSNSLNEASVDELLASIRDIIEENAGSAHAGEAFSNSENGHSSTRDKYSMSYNNSNADSGSSKGQDVNLAAKGGHTPQLQDAMNALAERIGLRKEAVPVRPDAMVKSHPAVAPAPRLQQPQRVHAVSEPSKADSSKMSARAIMPKQKRPAGMESEGAEAGKNFRSDVERSVELLLRPYIAQWLDAHFRQLFEKVLREEIQRFMQALQR